MAKKKKQTKKRKKKRAPIGNARDTHHLCYTRNSWGRGNLRKLRDYWYCKINIQRDTLHRKIHLELPAIPPPKDSSAKDALFQLEMLERFSAISEYDYIERRLELLASLFDCSDQETADAFRKQIQIVREWKSPPK